MHIALVNPNSTASMTERLARSARKASRPGTVISHRQPKDSPPAIEGVIDGARAVPLMLAEMAEADGEADAHVIACFDDTGLDAARALFHKPVIGIGEASMVVAGLVARRFCVVTTLARSVPIIEDNVLRYGLDRRCIRVYASDIPVLELETLDGGGYARISELVATGIAAGAEAVVLGCAGMVDLARRLETAHGVPVIEGVGAAIRLAELIVSSGLSTSKAGMWAFPAISSPQGARLA